MSLQYFPPNFMVIITMTIDTITSIKTTAAIL